MLSFSPCRRRGENENVLVSQVFVHESIFRSCPGESPLFSEEKQRGFTNSTHRLFDVLVPHGVFAVKVKDRAQWGSGVMI